jgi:acyl carrier protein
MNQDEIRDIVIATLKGIAPEVEAGELSPGQPLRDQVDLDSMDWLNFLIGVHRRLQVEIPEADYRQLTSIDAIVNYLAAKLS